MLQLPSLGFGFLGGRGEEFLFTCSSEVNPNRCVCGGVFVHWIFPQKPTSPFLDFGSLNSAELALWEEGKTFTDLSAKVPLILWQNLDRGLFHVGKGTLFVGSSDCGGHQSVSGATKDLVVGAFSSLLCYSERKGTIIS